MRAGVAIRTLASVGKAIAGRPWRNISHRPCSDAGFWRCQEGQILVMVIALVGVGSLLVIPMLTFVRASYGSIQRDTERALAYYAADAGVEAVLADLRQGVDALDPSYVPPSVALNGYTVSVSVAGPAGEDALPASAVFVDPESGTSLNPLEEGESFLYTITNVREGTPIQVNWVFTPAHSDWALKVYEGAGTNGTKVLDEDGGSSPATGTVAGDSVTGGTYTVRFENDDDDDTYSADFSPTGDPEKTWLRVTAFKGYVITATAGQKTLTVYAQQGPGSTMDQRSVAVVAWLGP